MPSTINRIEDDPQQFFSFNDQCKRLGIPVPNKGEQPSKLYEAFKEMVNSEITYINNIQRMGKKQHDAIIKAYNKVKNPEGAAAFDAAYNSLSQMQMEHQKVLQAMLHAKPTDVINNVAKLQKMYADYAIQFDRLAKAGFPPGVNDVMKKAGGPNLDTASYMILPVQRIPRYELFMKELQARVAKQTGTEMKNDVIQGEINKGNTPEERKSSSFLENLAAAFSQIKTVGKGMNESIRINQAYMDMDALMQPHLGKASIKETDFNKILDAVRKNNQLHQLDFNQRKIVADYVTSKFKAMTHDQDHALRMSIKASAPNTPRPQELNVTEINLQEKPKGILAQKENVAKNKKSHPTSFEQARTLKKEAALKEPLHAFKAEKSVKSSKIQELRKKYEETKPETKKPKARKQ